MPVYGSINVSLWRDPIPSAFVAAPSLVKARDMPYGACRFRSFGKRMRGTLPAWYNFIAGHDFQIKIKLRKVRCEFNGP